MDGHAARRRRCAVAAVLLACLLGAAGAAAGASVARAPVAAVAARGAPAGAALPGAEAGLPFIRNFEPAEYGGAPQNWALAQDRDGILYVGNVEDGVLTFDGTRWDRIAVPGRATVRSLAPGPDGRIYAGTVGDLGYLAPDRRGRLRFISLLDRLPAGERAFADVWNVHATADAVYFTTVSHVFRYRGGRFTTWKPRTSFHLSFLVDGTLYVRDVGHGLMRLQGDRLQPVPGGERFANERIYALLPWRGPGARPGELLIGTRGAGWFVFDGRTYRPWAIAADRAIQRGALYGATWLDDGRLAVATLQGGVFLLDGAGRLRRSLTRAQGLGTDVVFALLEDRQRGLWLATGEGISRVQVAAPLTRFGESSGLPGGVLALRRHGGTLYAGTTEGLFRLRPDRAGSARFERMDDVPGQSWQFARAAGQLLVASNDGVFALRDGGARRVLASEQSAFALLPSARDPGRVFVGLAEGVRALRMEDGRWIDEGLLAAVHEGARSLREDAHGGLWVGTWTGAVFRLQLPPAWPRQGTVRARRFGPAEGLPRGQGEVVAIDGRIRFATSAGVYRLRARDGRFVPDERFSGLFPDGPRQVGPLQQDRHGRIWMYTVDVRDGSKETGYAAAAADGRLRWTAGPLQPLAGGGMAAILHDRDGIVWFGGDQGLFRYDPARPLPGDARFAAMVRGVSAHDGTLLYAGGGGGVRAIPWARNALRFQLGAPSHDHAGRNSFRVLLEGVDRDWAPWSSDAFRDYTNIPEGQYRFRVRARNAYGREGEEASFAFRILPPWYRTAWAKTLWAVSGALALFGLLRWRSASLRRRNRELAGLVEQRTRELEQANAALREANGALAAQTMTDPLTGLKNRRYLHQRIAHELATPGREAGAGPSQVLFLLVDLDHFKQVNDSHGHAAGDQVLVQMGALLRATLRASDTPIRWGGEEFLVIARPGPGHCGAELAERIRAAIAGHAFELDDGRVLRCTCSVGFAAHPFFGAEPERMDWQQVMDLADACLYAAKHGGRDRWIGVAAAGAPLAGSALDALRAALAGKPVPELRLFASESCAGCAGDRCTSGGCPALA